MSGVQAHLNLVGAFEFGTLSWHCLCSLYDKRASENTPENVI